ncbi:MAG: PAS domain-containing protein [Gemmatimonadales bacterium]|nr:MAG: PAS domain-containing protein [Gemmatimonadales bacterium]
MQLKLESPSGDFPVSRELLRWIYLGRVILVSFILVGALFIWRTSDPLVMIVAVTVFLTGIAATAGSFWWTHVLNRQPGPVLRYGQVLLDALLVTATVHITSGIPGAPSDFTSDFSPLYILVISEGALLLPLAGGVLMGVLVSLLFFADIVWLQGGALDTLIVLQITLFGGVALATGILGDRLRRAGTRLGVVESELRQLRLDTTEILDSLTTGVLTVDSEARIAYLNHAGARLLGVDAAGHMGKPVNEVLGNVAPAMGRLLMRSVQDRVPVLRFKTTMERDGRPVVIGVSTTIMDHVEDGSATTTAIFQDITNKERADILDRRNQRLEAVAELSASLAHEIKNPLASIRSSVEQLTTGGLEHRDRETLRRLVLEQSDRLSRLLSEFLEFSALRKGESERVDIATLARDAAQLARQHPDVPNGAEVLCNGLDTPVHIPGDADLLHRAVYNLTLNALQFSGAGGEVTLTLSDHREGGRPEGVKVEHPVRLAVCDSGPGIGEEEAARIFDPFYTTRPGGNGLGLSVVHRAVEAHRGAVYAGNAPGGGAEFVMYLPGVEDGHE